MNFHYKGERFRILWLFSVLVLATSIFSLISTNSITADGSVSKVKSQDDDGPKKKITKVKKGSIKTVKSRDDGRPKIEIDSYRIGDRVKVVGEITGIKYNDGFLNSD